MKKGSTVAILGAGAWGTAVAMILARNGHTVYLWCYEPEVAQNILQYRENKQYLSDVKLSPLIIATNSLQDAITQADIIFEAVPVLFLREILNKAKSFIKTSHSFVMLSKGIEQKSLFLPTQIVQDCYGDTVKTVVVSGPSYAREVVAMAPTGLIVASQDKNSATIVQQLLKNNYCVTYESSDEIGAQVGGALKNVIALAIGIIEGAGYGDNTKALLITRGLAEMASLAICLGGARETVYGLSGVGDLALTALGKQSKNKQFGNYLGTGKSMQEATSMMGIAPEGVNTVASITALAKKCNLTLPLCLMVHAIVQGTKKVNDLIQVLQS